MKDEIVKLLKDTAARHRTRVIQKNALMLQWFEKNFPQVTLNISIDSLLKNISPFCMVCGNPVKNLGKKTCSITCRSIELAKHKNTIVEKRKQTLLKKYGVDNPAKITEIQDKRISTMIEKYGQKISPKTLEKIISRTDNLNKKGRQTLKEKYDVDNPGQIMTHREKCRKKLLENYGVDNYFESDSFKQKQIEKNFAKWNCIFPATIQLLNISPNLDKKQIFQDPNQELEFVCIACNNAEKIPTETAKWRTKNTGTPCKKCSGINQGSLKQAELQSFIESLGIKTISNFKMKNEKQIDIFCPKYKVGFEFNGLFWHNDLRLHKKYHLEKTNKAARQDIRLIHIFEDEWDHKQNIVQSRIKNIFKITSHNIFARKCSIELVDSINEKSFLETNHIQGYARSSICLGLFYQNELISLMSFSKPNIAKGQKNIDGHWELLRFCSKNNSNVVGGASKLFQHFINSYQPIQILSFADKRWSQGSLYEILGFEKKIDTAINYWYINLKEGKRIHRFAMRKNELDNENLTEYQNRLNQGYLRIWDCGSSKWIWSNKNPN